MEEDKIQKLHDTLSKLKKGKGLGTSSHYNFGGGHTSNNGIPFKEGKDGKIFREDGLPINALYSNFVKEGSYSKQDSALKYGDGRVIKRNFDDCANEDDENSKDNENSRSIKKRKKEEKKALKKAEKLEAKKQVNNVNDSFLEWIWLGSALRLPFSSLKPNCFCFIFKLCGVFFIHRQN